MTQACFVPFDESLNNFDCGLQFDETSHEDAKTAVVDQPALTSQLERLASKQVSSNNFKVCLKVSKPFVPK